MEYTVSQFAQLSGVSARTLRYYDEIDLLKPKRVHSNGYRIYGEKEVDLLQQILFYRELEMKLEDIKIIMAAEDFTVEQALKNHLIDLNEKRNRLDDIIAAVEKSLSAKQGGQKMTDKEKFEAFKKESIQENEAKYGDEIREKYGDEVIDASNETFTEMTQEDFGDLEKLTNELNTKLAEATKEGNPKSPLAQEVASLHQKWIKAAWPEGYYNEEKHYNLSVMYVEDPRFKAYYEEIAPGAAEFLHEALRIYLNK